VARYIQEDTQHKFLLQYPVDRSKLPLMLDLLQLQIERLEAPALIPRQVTLIFFRQKYGAVMNIAKEIRCQ